MRKEEHKYDEGLETRLKGVSQKYSESVNQLVEITRQLNQKSNKVYMHSALALLPPPKTDLSAADDDKVNKYLKLLARRSQFSFDELRKVFIDCRKNSKVDGEVCLDKEQFAQVMKRYGYGNEKITNHLFDLFDEDRSNAIDFEEMVLGLASLRPEALELNAERFFQVMHITTPEPSPQP